MTTSIRDQKLAAVETALRTLQPIPDDAPNQAAAVAAVAALQAALDDAHAWAVSETLMMDPSGYIGAFLVTHARVSAMLAAEIAARNFV